VPPKLFARERSALVDQIRRAGDEKTAKIVKARRAPTIPVWVVNRLALAHPTTVDELIEAADRVKAILLGRRQEASGLSTEPSWIEFSTTADLFSRRWVPGTVIRCSCESSAR
jgi:hypothetical protein